MIKGINYQETYQLRHEVMWPEENLDYIKLEDDPIGKHYGYFLNGELIVVISVFVNDDTAQIRKFACKTKLQGMGYGSKLLSSVIQQTHVTNIWLNARIEKAGFYEKFGFVKTDKSFTKKNNAYIIMALKKAVQ